MHEALILNIVDIESRRKAFGLSILYHYAESKPKKNNKKKTTQKHKKQQQQNIHLKVKKKSIVKAA